MVKSVFCERKRKAKIMDFQLVNVDIFSIKEMIELTKENYGEIEISNPNFLKWQYEDNPSGKAFIKLAYHEDELAGQYIVIPMKIKVYKSILSGSLSLNTLTRKKYRGKGLFTMLAESIYSDCKDAEVAFTYGFPNQNSFPGFIKKLKFVNLGSLPLMVRPINLKSMFQKKFGNAVISSLGGMCQFFFKNALSNQFYDVIEMGINDLKLFDEFWEDIKEKYDIIGVRNSEYIKWRYMDIPLREYKIFGYMKSDKLVAYVVTRTTDIETFKSGMIVDFLCLNRYEKLGEYLIQYVLDYFSKEEMDMVGCLISQYSQEYKILKRNKFFRTPKALEPQPFPVIFRSHVEGDVEYSLQNWFLTMGDYDVI